MPPRPLPDFLKSGDATLGVPRKSPYARFKAIIGTAQPPDPVLPEGCGQRAGLCPARMAGACAGGEIL